jgi:hypothetical protein
MIEGYMIVNRDWTDSVQLEMGLSSLARTPVSAWRRHVNIPDYRQDFSILVQRWSDKGYGPIKVKVEKI